MTEESMRSAFVQSSEREHMKTRSPQYFRNLFAISQWAVRHVEICQGSVWTSVIDREARDISLLAYWPHAVERSQKGAGVLQSDSVTALSHMNSQ